MKSIRFRSILMMHIAKYPPPLLSYPNEEGAFTPQENEAEAKMDPDSLPRPTTLRQTDATNTPVIFDSERLSYPPSSASSFSCIDSGNTTFRHARLVTHHVPAWPSLYLSSGLPLGCIFQPFAETEGAEEPVSISQPSSGSHEPFRCPKCNGFGNPNFIWLDEGRKFKCNLCFVTNDVPNNYYSSINAYGVRADQSSRIELRRGSADLVPSAGSVVTSPAPVMLFVIDSSYLSVHSGFFDTVIRTIRDNISGVPLETEVGIILFDTAINCIKFELSRNGAPALVTVGDVDDPFVPDPTICVSPHLLSDQFLAVLRHFLDYPPKGNPNRVATCANAAVAVATDIAAERGGGTVTVFQAGPCKVGYGCVPDRQSTQEAAETVYSVDPQQESFTRSTERKCKQNNVCLDIFACSDSIARIGLEALCKISSRTGGLIHMCSGVDLTARLGVYLQQPKYHNCTLKIRASKGLQVETVDVSNSTQTGIDSVSICRMSPDTSVACIFSVSEALEQHQPVYLQLVCLYTRSDGARLIRVHNVTMKPTAQISHAFKFADMEALGLLMARHAISTHMEKSKRSIKETVVRALVTILHAYRISCASASPDGQLILPDSLKTLPLMLSGFLKQPGIRSDVALPHGDERVVSFYRLKQMNCRELVYTLLPRIFCVYPLTDGAGLLEGNKLEMPAPVAASRAKFVPTRIYLFDRFDTMMFYVGKEVAPAVLESLFGKEVAAKQMDPRKSTLMDVKVRDDSVVSLEWVNRIGWIVHALDCGRGKRLKCVLSSSSSGEAKISNLLIEDRHGTEAGYVDWLCHIHRLIQEKIEY